MKTINGLYVYIKSSFRISRMKFFCSFFNIRNKFIKEFAISKNRFFKLWHENFFGGKKSFVLISDFKTVMNLYKLETAVLLERKFKCIKGLDFILCFLLAKPTSKGYKLFTKLYVVFFIVKKIST